MKCKLKKGVDYEVKDFGGDDIHIFSPSEYFNHFVKSLCEWYTKEQLAYLYATAIADIVNERVMIKELKK